MRNRVAFIIPYFGKLPDMYYLWLKSAEAECNKIYDFKIYTDIAEINGNDKNIQVKRMRFDDFVNKIQSNYKFDIQCNKAIKVCDFRPAFGEIFKEDLRDYDWWGYVEWDLIMGDLSKYITDEILDKYEKLYVLGHMALFKNIDKINTIYKLTAKKNDLTYKEIFQNPENCSFEELARGKENINEICYKNNIKMYNDNTYADIYPYNYSFIRSIHNNEQSLKENKLVRIHDKTPEIFAYEKGCVYRYYLEEGKMKIEEVRYVHFQKRPMEIEPNINDDFVMVPNRIFSMARNDITIDFIKRNSRNKIIYVHAIKMHINNKLKQYNIKK